MTVCFAFPLEFGQFPDIYEYVTLLRESGIDAHYIGIQRTNAQGPRLSYVDHAPPEYANDLDAFSNYISEKLERINPDIVHIFHYRGSGRLARGLRKRITSQLILDIRTIHVESRRGTTNSVLSFAKDKLTWMEANHFDYHLMLTDAIRRRMYPRTRPSSIIPLGASKDRLALVNKTYTSDLVRKHLHIAPASPVFAYVGSLSSSRRIDTILDAFEKVQRNRMDVTLLMVGGTPGCSPETDAAIKPLRDRTSQLRIANSVLFTGWQPYPKALDYVLAADIGVSYLPPRTPYAHQPPTKVIECMMARVLTVSNLTPGLCDLIEDGVTGFVTDSTVTGLAAGMLRALGHLVDTVAAERMRTIAQLHVADRDWRHLVSDYLLPVYRQLIR